jgi:hypothetical protein
LGYELEGPYMVKFLSWQHKSDVLKFCNAILGIGIETQYFPWSFVSVVTYPKKKKKKKRIVYAGVFAVCVYCLWAKILKTEGSGF